MLSSPSEQRFPHYASDSGGGYGGAGKEPTFTEIVRGWESPKDALRYAKSLGITKEQLTNSGWLQNKAKLPKKEGGIGKDLNALYVALRDHFKGFNKFKEWMGIKTEPSFTEIIHSWKSPKDALRYAKSIGITKEQLTNSGWLRNKAKLSKKEEGIGKNLNALYLALRDHFDGFNKFKEWMGVEPKFTEIVRSWKSPQDALRYAKSLGITKEQLTTPSWLSEKAKLSKKEGGIGKDLNALYVALRDHFEGWDNFKIWMGIEPRQTNSEFIRDLLATPEGKSLENLARNLGEAAVAEYLSVKYQDRFQYDSSTVGNLRNYLGRFEVPQVTNPADIPEGVLTIDKLSDLRRSLFNQYRDHYQPLFSKEGIRGVRRELNKEKKQAELPAQKEFLQSIVNYFQVVNEIERPLRLRSQIGGEGEYPAKHQKIAVHEIVEEKSVLLADEMGGGKTGSAIAGFEYLRDYGEAEKALVVCPAQVMDVWKKALSDGPDGLYKKGEAPKVAFLGNGETDLEKIKDADIVVASLEWTRGRNKKTGRTNENLLKRIGADYFIFDESHNTKRPGGKDTERIFRISQTKSIREGHLVLLSGTPAPNKVRDIAAQIRLLYAGREKIKGVDLRNLSSLARSLVKNSSPLLVRNFLVRKMLRRKAEDCLPVGSSFRKEIIRTPLNPLDRARYDTIIEYPFYTATEKLLELRKTCLISDSKYHATKNAVTKALRRDKYKKSKKPPKIVIAEASYAKGITRDQKDLRWDEEDFGDETYFASRLTNDFKGKVKVFVLDGKNSNKRSEILNEFEKCKEPAALVTLVPVIGEGLNISCASDGILISPTFNVATEEQFLRRLFRRGQTQDVDFQVLQFAQTIEQGIQEYADRKHRVICGLVDGRPLNAEEREILNSDYRQIKEKGPIAYEAKTPQEKALWVLSRLYGKSKEEIERFLASEDGKYARDFAEGYPQSEVTSQSGNNARLVSAIINELKPKRKVELVDIACGCRTLERMYEGNKSVAVSSLDINKAALEAGSRLLKKTSRVKKSEIGSMDNLPYRDESKDIAVISMALEFTCHSSNGKRGAAGKERIRTLSELSRVLKPNGIGVISFQDRLFKDVATFKRFSKTIKKHFGFEIEGDHTGRVSSVDSETGHKFSGWVLTVRKIDEPEEELNSAELYKNLMFPRKRTSSEPKSPSPRTRKKVEESGAYHDTFSIGLNEVEYRPNTPIQKKAKRDYDEECKEAAQLGKRLKTLVKKHGSVKDIPEHMLLSISLSQVKVAKQKERDLYFRALLEYYGDVSRVPVEMISKKSPFVMIRGFCKKKGYYLCLASMNGKRKNKGGFGSRYFHNEELRSTN